MKSVGSPIAKDIREMSKSCPRVMLLVPDRKDQRTERRRQPRRHPLRQAREEQTMEQRFFHNRRRNRADENVVAIIAAVRRHSGAQDRRVTQSTG